MRQKIDTEKNEIDRLHQEIDEVHYLRQDSDMEEMSDSSDSSYESEDEEDLQEMLEQVIADNEGLEVSIWVKLGIWVACSKNMESYCKSPASA